MQRCFNFLRIHHETRIAGDCHRGTFRVRDRGYRARHRDTHRGKTVRDKAGIGAFGLVHPGHPHLVRADPTRRCPRGERGAQVPHNLLGFDGETLVFGVAPFHRRLPAGSPSRSPGGRKPAPQYHPALRRYRLRPRSISAHRLPPAVNRNGNPAGSILMPQARVVFDNVIADAYDDVGPVYTA